MKPLFGRYGVQEIPHGFLGSKWLWVELTSLTIGPTDIHPSVMLRSAKEPPPHQRRPIRGNPVLALNLEQASTLAAALKHAVDRARKEQVVRKLELPI